MSEAAAKFENCIKEVPWLSLFGITVVSWSSTDVRIDCSCKINDMDKLFKSVGVYASFEGNSLEFMGVGNTLEDCVNCLIKNTLNKIDSIMEQVQRAKNFVRDALDSLDKVCMKLDNGETKLCNKAETNPFYIYR